MSALYSLSSDFVVRPIAWGACASAPDTYFYLSDFHELSEDSPNVETFCARIAELHVKSTVKRRSEPSHDISGRRFGFHVTTHLGMLPQDTRWCATWENYYIQDLKRILAFEERTQGPLDDLDALATQLIEKVIPRLLRPLETGGREVAPTLIHGDLQVRNARTDLATGLPIIFDAGSFWGHNECNTYDDSIKRICFIRADSGRRPGEMEDTEVPHGYQVYRGVS